MELKEYLKHIERHEIPPEPPSGLGFNDYSSTDMFAARDVCTNHGSWVVIADTWIKPLAEWIGDRKCLEIMSGAGWLAKGLQNHGVNIVATDSYRWNERHTKMQFLTDVLQYEATKAVEAFGDTQVLVVSWPPYGKDHIVDACKAWGDRGSIVYIGEDQGGCNAPDEFFQQFYIDDSAPSIHLPQWYGLHDRIMIGVWGNGSKRRGVSVSAW